MVGLDGDTVDTFQRSLEFLIDNKISFLKLFTPCPYPGTKYYDDMLQADRIVVHDWGRYDYGSPLIRPAQMTTDEMMDGFKYVYEGFYSDPRHRPPPLPAAHRQLPRDARLPGRQPEGEPLPAQQRERLGDDLVARAAGSSQVARAADRAADAGATPRALVRPRSARRTSAHAEQAASGDAAKRPRLVASRSRAWRAASSAASAVSVPSRSPVPDIRRTNAVRASSGRSGLRILRAVQKYESGSA